MSTYIYKCKKCDKTFEVVQSIKSNPYIKHSEADKESNCAGEIRRLISAASLIFKGSGFYINDYKKSSENGKK